jgi:hypothetical protein
MTRPTVRLLPFLALALALTSAACGDDAFEPTTSTTAATTTGATTSTTDNPATTGAAPTTAATTTTATTTTTTAATTTTIAPFDGDTDDKTGAGAGGLLTDVRIGDHEGFTRIVFDFREPTFPNWEFGYVAGELHGMIEPEGGWVEGDAFLIARFQPSMTADISGPDVVITYGGPRRIDVGVGSVVQLLIIEDFEANLWWAIGLTGEKPFRVGTLAGPPRVFVDIAD